MHPYHLQRDLLHLLPRHGYMRRDGSTGNDQGPHALNSPALTQPPRLRSKWNNGQTTRTHRTLRFEPPVIYPGEVRNRQGSGREMPVCFTRCMEYGVGS